MKGRDSESVLDKKAESLPLSTPPPSPLAQSAWLKMDLTILPIIAMFYFLSFLVSARLGFTSRGGFVARRHNRY